MAEENQSVGWVVWMLALAVAGAGWGFLAADYFQNNPTGETGKANFFINAIEQLPNLPKVMSHALANRRWLLVLIGGLEVGVVVVGLVLKTIEREMNGKPKSAARRR